MLDPRGRTTTPRCSTRRRRHRAHRHQPSPETPVSTEPPATTAAPTGYDATRPTTTRVDRRTDARPVAGATRADAPTTVASTAGSRPARGLPARRPFQRRAPRRRSTPARSVLVAAPTGSGKTLVAEYAIEARARRRSQGLLHDAAEGAVEPEVRRPRRRARRERVGLLTGDNSVNGDAPIVVMTTEVLRNMIYAASPTLDGLALRRARRGPLPAGPLPRPGVGGGDHPPRPRGAASCASRRRSRTPRRSRTWIDDGARPDRARSSRSAGRSRSRTSTWWGSGAATASTCSRPSSRHRRRPSRLARPGREA